MTSKSRYASETWASVLERSLHPAERLMLGTTFCIGLACLALASLRGVSVDWEGFATGIGAAFLLVGIGIYARTVSSAPRLALCAIGFGVFMSFTGFCAIFIFALFPLPNPLIDQHLAAADAALGFDWIGFVEALSAYPAFAKALAYLYHSSLPQIGFTVVVLAAYGRDTALHRFLLVGILAMAMTVAVWWLVPSVGPLAFQTVDPKTAALTGMTGSAKMGAYLLDLVRQGPAIVAPEAITGVVAFPSYHIIMAMMVAWYSFRTIAFAPLALASAGMVPATIAHGGHYLVDLIAGAVIFLICVRFAAALVPER